MRSRCSPKPAARPKIAPPGGEAGEGEPIRLGGCDLRRERRAGVAAERARGKFAVHAAHVLGEIGQAQAPSRQFGIVLRTQQSRREPDSVKRRPEPVLWMGVIGAAPGRDSARRRAAEDDAKARLEHVGQHVRKPARIVHQIVWL